ncbi:MAG: hypothetical protein KF795_07545 [Labilithrix sp.]|nr:hypothetical protein [Labilithrix sp.]
MKLANLALVSVTLLGILAVGCKRDDDADDDSALGSSEAQLVEDDSEATEVDDDLEAGLDEPLSGASEADPGAPADGASDDEVLEKVRTNPGRFFKPAGCITSTREGNTITHVFAGCTGPYGMARFDGTVVSTYTREPGKLTVTHQADGFSANGATISGSRVVVYTRDGSLITKSRTGSWTGTTAKGKPISHEASFVTTYDASAKCITRDGSAQTSLGGRSFERTIDGYKRCGIGRGGCPESGTIVLSRTKDGESLSITIAFPGGAKFRVTRPNGKEVTRLLLCRPNAT